MRDAIISAAVRRAVLIAVVLVALAGTATTNILLSRIDTARAEAHRAYVHTAVLRVELAMVRAAIPKPGAVDELCRRRTDALRSAVFALVRTGNASMTGTPEWSWLEWPVATSSPTTRAAAVR